MITRHNFIEKYPFDKSKRRLILGTIHPHDVDGFLVQFFYGSSNNLWSFLAKGCPTHLKNPHDLEDIQSFLSAIDATISDTIISCERKSNSALDKDLIPLELNHQLIKYLRDSKVEEILFTSGYNKNNAFKIFFLDILKEKYIPSEIKKNRTMKLGSNYFGRPIQLTLLYSPSNRARAGISRSQKFKNWKSQNPTRTVDDFRVKDYYDVFSRYISR